MTAITYLTGDATAPIGDGPKIIAHVVNDIGVFGVGFALAVAKKWPVIKQTYIEWSQNKFGYPFELGQIQFLGLEYPTFIANMCAQRGIGLDEQGEPPIRYTALRMCLYRVMRIAKQWNEWSKKENHGDHWITTVHMPRVGCGLAGGEWSVVEKIIEEVFAGTGVKVFVYDLPKNK